MIRILLATFAGLALLTAAGCQDLGVGHEGEDCNKQGQCLPGLVCEDGTCVRPADGDDGGADADGDAGQPDDGDGGQADDGGGGGDEPPDGADGPGDGDDDVNPHALTETWAKAWEALGAIDYGPGSLRVAVTKDGHVLVAGIYDHNFEFVDGLAEPRTASGGDIFIAKFSSAGQFVWARSFKGQTGVQRLGALAVGRDGLDQTDYYYIGGSFRDRLDFDFYDQSTPTCATEDEDAFVACLAEDGTVRWVRCWDGAGPARVTALTPAANLRVYAAGHYQGEFGDEGIGQSSSSAGFVLALSPSDGTTVAKTAIKGTSHVYPKAVVFRPGGGTIYVAGTYLGRIENIDDLPVDATFASTNTGTCGFLLALPDTLDGNCTFAFSLSDDGEPYERDPTEVNDLKFVGLNDLWLTGSYEGSLQISDRDLQTVSSLPLSSGEDAWLAHIHVPANPADTVFIWAQAFGESSTQRGHALAGGHYLGPDLTSPIHWTGWFNEVIAFGDDPLPLPSGQSDAFFASFGVDHGHLWSRAFGVTQAQEGRDLAVTQDGTVYLAGISAGDIMLAGRAYSASGTLVFLVRLDPPGD